MKMLTTYYLICAEMEVGKKNSVWDDLTIRMLCIYLQMKGFKSFFLSLHLSIYANSIKMLSVLLFEILRKNTSLFSS